MELIYTYIRAQAVKDGFQVKCDTAPDAGFKCPVYITNGIDELLKELLTFAGCGYKRIMYNTLRTLHAQIEKNPDEDYLKFQVCVKGKAGEPKLIDLIAMLDAVDIDDPQPAITVMFPDES